LICVAEEATGRTVHFLCTPEDVASQVPEEEFGTALKEGTAPNIRWHIRKDGARVFIDGNVVALRDTEGAVRRFLKIGQDVTARKIAEERQTLLAREVDHRAKTEEGGPQVAGPPERRGFGTRMLEGTARQQLGGTVTLHWRPSGLVCEMRVPLRRGAASPDP
jgi:two-component sensor histidine kinase